MSEASIPWLRLVEDVARLGAMLESFVAEQRDVSRRLTERLEDHERRSQDRHETQARAWEARDRKLYAVLEEHQRILSRRSGAA